MTSLEYRSAYRKKEELSGIGAGFVAGLSAGIYDENIFDNMNRTRYSCKMDDEVRQKLYAGWLDAVKGVMTRT